MDPLSLIQWNCQSINNKKSEIIYLANKFNISVFCLSETWLKPGKNFSFPGYTILRDDRIDGFAGSAILVKNNFHIKPINIPAHSNNIQVVAIRLLPSDVTICSVYIPSPSLSVIRELYSIVSELPSPIIIVGDFNCHNVSWGSTTTDVNGGALAQLMESFDLCTLNSGSQTFRNIPMGNKSCIDVTFCSSKIFPDFSWDPLFSTHGSRHFPILIKNNKIKAHKNVHSPMLKYNLNNADFNKYQDLLTLKVQNLPSIEDDNLAMCSDALTELITSCADECFPSKVTSSKIPSPPWWDKECTDACKKRKEAEFIFSKNINEENYSNLNLVSIETKKILNEKKSAGWIKFCSTLSPDSPPNKIWENIRKYRGSFNSKSHFSVPCQEWADRFMDHLAPPTCPSMDEIPSFTPPSPSPSQNILDSPFSMNELKFILLNLTDSAPGLDGIPYSLIKNAPSPILEYFLSLFNKILTTGIVPYSWKTQVIIPIPKPGKDPDVISSYRAIALSPCLTKIGEHLVKNRLDWFIESEDILPNFQYGFRKGRSTIDILAIFTSDIRISLSENKYLSAAFLDITGAYDNVQIPILMSKLNKINVPSKICNFLQNLLTERQISIKSDPSISSHRYVYKGLPQGSVLSPLLFNIYIHDIQFIPLGDCQILQYADDIVVYSSNSNINKTIHDVNNCISSLGGYLDSNGLSLSASKSSTVIFSKRKKSPSEYFSYNDEPIPTEDKVKFLGIFLDSKLKGSYHVDYIVGKCERQLNILRCLSGCWWGAHPYTLKLIYNAIIRSILDYASFLLFPLTKKDSKKLDLIQYKAHKIIIGAMNKSPANALQIECGDPPLHLRRQYLSDRFLFRCLQYSYHPLINKLLVLNNHVVKNKYWTNKQTPYLINSFVAYNNIRCSKFHAPKYPVYEFPLDTLLYKPEIISNLDVKKSDPFAASSLSHVLGTEWEGWSFVYSDASKESMTGCVGVGVYHPQYKINIEKKCPPLSSVFTGECIGIREAIKYSKLCKLKKVIILSDSLSALKSIIANPFKVNNPVILEIKSLLFEYAKDVGQIRLAWVPSHCGIPGNEKADSLAKDAVMNGDYDTFRLYPTDIANAPKLSLHNSWNDTWNENHPNRFYNIQPHIPKKPWYYKIFTSKLTTSTICRMRIGFCSSPVFLNKIKIRDTSLCECGIEDGTLDHIFFSCPLYNHNSFLEALSKILFLPVNMSFLLANINPSIVAAIVAFISLNKIKL